MEWQENGFQAQEYKDAPKHRKRANEKAKEFKPFPEIVLE